MAKKAAAGKNTGTKRSAKANNDDNVVRIKASSSAPKKEKKAAAASTVSKPVAAGTPKAKKEKNTRGNIFTAIGGYFKGAWVELRQVRWPTRRATWGLTGAVLIYSAFFVVLVLLLDALFKYLFEVILGK